jgi:hypothetical protein
MKKVLQVLSVLLTLSGMPLLAQSDTTKVLIGVDIPIPLIRDFSPPPFYEKLWREAMVCTGLHITEQQIKKVKWTFVTAESFSVAGSQMKFIGYTFVWDSRIILVIDGIDDSRLIKHEMVHYLMWQNGEKADHPPKYYVKCNLLR